MGYDVTEFRCLTGAHAQFLGNSIA